MLTYALAIVEYSTKQEDEQNASWNTVYNKLFVFNMFESVNKSHKCGVGRLDLCYIIQIQHTKLYIHVLRVCNFL